MSSLPVLHCWASKGPRGTPLLLFSGETEAGTCPKITLRDGRNEHTMSAAQVLNPGTEKNYLEERNQQKNARCGAERAN